MKNVLSISLILLLLSSCIKYEEGPSFSFLSKEKRLTRSWELTKVEYFNSQDSTYTEGTTYPFYLEFSKDKTLKFKIQKNGVLEEYVTTWDWHLATWGVTLDLTDNIQGNNGIRNYQILRLTKKEFWIYDRVAGNKYYFNTY